MVYKPLFNTSSNSSNLVFLCIILACLVLGVDLIGKLYKNSLTVGVSRTEFFLAKFVVLASIALMQILVSLVIAFVPATILNGLGTMPEGFIGNLLLTIALQFSLPSSLAIYCVLHSLCDSFLFGCFHWLFDHFYLAFNADAYLSRY